MLAKPDAELRNRHRELSESPGVWPSWRRDRAGDPSIPNDLTSGGVAAALDWYATMPEPALAGMCAGQASVRRFTGTPCEMRQPALSENILCMHLGGAKQIRRWHDGRLDVHDVPLGALTLMPAGQSNRWLTHGPVDFAHLVLPPRLLEQVALEEYGADAHELTLPDRVSFRDPASEALFTDLLGAVERRPGQGGLYADSLLVVLIVRLLKTCSPLADRGRAPGARTMSRGGLPPWRLRRIVDYMHANLRSDIGLDELTALSGLSRAQFFRAFKQSTGLSPHRYLTALRLDAARDLLDAPQPALADIGPIVGLPSSARFASLFRHRFGLTPKAYLSTRA